METVESPELPDDGSGRIQGLAFTAHALRNHVGGDVVPKCAESIVGNAWEKVMNSVMVVAADEPA